MLVILHGWSDTAKSFQRLGRRLVEEGLATGVTHVRLGDYVSMDDHVGFEDLSEALQAAWKKEGLSTAVRTVDVVVHSTGALVIRHWMTKYFKPQTNPIRRLLMLAPANFGSPLAHKGRSFIGRIVKGYDSDRPFETGERILKGLELASPFSWELAEKDRFCSDAWYGPGRVLCTVMVGTTGYSGISAAANEDGTDGTVRVSTANLNPVRITLDFSADPANPPQPKLETPAGLTAFARIPDENHSTIALKDGGPKDDDTLPVLLEALRVTDSGFPASVDRLEAFSELMRRQSDDEDRRPFAHGYQNTVVRLQDSAGDLVGDYFFEAFAKTADGKNVQDELTAYLQESVLSTVHAYEDNAAYRSLLFNTTRLENGVSGLGHALYIALTAMPDVRKTGTVGYSTFGYEDIGSIRLSPETTRKVFRPDRTVLIDLKLKRVQLEKVFRLLPLS